MENPNPNIFTDADIRAINIEHGKRFPGGIKVHLEIERLAREVESWFRRDSETHWLSLGLDIVTDGVTGYGTASHPRSWLRDALEESISESKDEATDEYPCPWDDENERLAFLWLDVSLYKLWTIIQEARSHALDVLDEQLIFYASGDDTGYGLASVVEERFADSVREWRDEVRAREAA
jgi:hypothetical protein